MKKCLDYYVVIFGREDSWNRIQYVDIIIIKTVIKRAFNHLCSL